MNKNILFIDDEPDILDSYLFVEYYRESSILP